MELSENAIKVLKARYLLKDDQGRVIESPREMFGRIARSIAAAEELYGESPAPWEERFFDLISSLRFLPNSPAIMNAGKAMGQLTACFVLPVDDSMQSIFDTLKNAALILQSGGGTGFSFSHLRPRSDIVRSTGGIASGPVSFMKIYNTATNVIKQGGARRGANMGILNIDHPDILEFIRVKRAASELTNFNGSIYDAPGMPRVRNATTTTIAPTGTLATIANCSSGIEPYFALAYKRLVLDTELEEINKYFLKTAKEQGFYSAELMREVLKRGNLKGISGVPTEVRRLFRTALEIHADDHIEMQAAFQEHIDNAVSKTINLPAKAGKDEVARAYLLAYEKGLKGITVFRYGAKRGTLIRFADVD